jgi:hypothetical protein
MEVVEGAEGARGQRHDQLDEADREALQGRSLPRAPSARRECLDLDELGALSSISGDRVGYLRDVSQHDLADSRDEHEVAFRKRG